MISAVAGIKKRLLILYILLLIAEVEGSELSRIEDLIKESRYREALELLEGMRPEGDNRGLYYLLRAKSFTGLERFTDALSALSLAVSSGTAEVREEAMYLRAELYFRKRFYPEASTHFELFLKEFPESRFRNEALLALSESLRKSGRYDEALRYYEKAGNCTACLFGKANTLHLMGRHNDANKLYLELLLKDSGYIKAYPETILLIGENMMLVGKKEEARRFLNSVKEPPYKYHAYILLGEMEMASGRLNDALKFFEQSLQGSDHKLRQRAYLLSAEVLFSQGRLNEAEKRLDELISSYPFGEVYERSLLLLSDIYKKEGRYRESAIALKGLLLKRQPSAEASERLKSLMLETAVKERDTFLRLWMELRRFFLDTRNINFLFDIAVYMKNSKKEFFELSRWLYKNTGDLDKRKASFLFAEFYSIAGETDMALGILNDIRPEKDEEKRLMAKLFLDKKDYESTFKYLTGLKELKSEDIPLIIELSLYKKDQIIPLFERAISIIDAPAQAYIRLADLLYKVDKKRALNYYRMALSEKKRTELGQRDIEWANYRIALISGKPSVEEKEVLTDLLHEEKNTFSRLRRNL